MEKEKIYFEKIKKTDGEFIDRATRFFEKIRTGEVIVIGETPFSHEVAFIFNKDLPPQIKESYKNFVNSTEGKSDILERFLKNLKIKYIMDVNVTHYFEWAEHQLPIVYEDTIRCAAKNSIVLNEPNPKESLTWELCIAKIKEFYI